MFTFELFALTDQKSRNSDENLSDSSKENYDDLLNLDINKNLSVSTAQIGLR